jgi:hypothetical protein
MRPIEGLEFFERWHRYRLHGEWLNHSVTEVLSHDMPPEKLAMIMRYKDGPDGWAARGNACHKALETHLSGEGIIFDNKWAPWIDPLLDCPLFQGAEVLALEHRLCDEKKSLGGSFDFLLRDTDGKLVLGDLKTVSKKPAVKRREPATKQLGAYVAMLNTHYPFLFIDQCVTVVSGPGECKVLKEDPNECLGQWIDAWNYFEITLEDW